jgi:hypothetical protein
MAGDRGWNFKRGLGALSIDPEVLRVIPELRDLDFCILLLKVIKSIWPAYNIIILFNRWASKAKTTVTALELGLYLHLLTFKPSSKSFSPPSTPHVTS